MRARLPACTWSPSPIRYSSAGPVRWGGSWRSGRDTGAGPSQARHSRRKVVRMAPSLASPARHPITSRRSDAGAPSQPTVSGAQRGNQFQQLTASAQGARTAAAVRMEGEGPAAPFGVFGLVRPTFYEAFESDRAPCCAITEGGWTWFGSFLFTVVLFAFFHMKYKKKVLSRPKNLQKSKNERVLRGYLLAQQKAARTTMPEGNLSVEEFEKCCEQRKKYPLIFKGANTSIARISGFG